MRDEEGNIGTEFGREFHQQVVRKTGIEKFVEAQESAGSITAAAAQTRSMRNFFFECQRDPVGALCSFPKKLRRADNQVIVGARQRWIVAGKSNLVVVPCPFD